MRLLLVLSVLLVGTAGMAWPASLVTLEEYLPWPLASTYRSVATATSCFTCRSLVELLGRMLSSGDLALGIVRDGWHDLCLKSAPGFGVCQGPSCEVLCQSLYQTYEPVFGEAIRDNPGQVHVIARQACAKYANCDADSPANDDHVTELSRRIMGSLDMAFLTHRPQNNPENRSDTDRFYFLQLTDVHMDLNYAIGSEASCPLPSCCHSSSALPPLELKRSTVTGNNATLPPENATPEPSITSPAGPMGHLSCDPPPWLVKDGLSAVPRDKLKFVIWTGDNPSHDQCWEADKQSSLEASLRLTEIVREAFPDVPVFPCIGNHEIVPIDMYHADARVDAWLYSSMADVWSSWLPPSAIDTLRAYGYYTAPIEKGLRIISLNTNFWIAADWLKIARHEDINHQVAWLSETLEQAEKDLERVYIIGHMPLGDEDQDDDLTLVIRMILHRYRNIIEGLFFGHKHEDIIKVITDPRDNKTPVSTLYVAPAFTPFQDRSPSFRIYEASSSTKEILDYHQYRLAPGALESAVTVDDKLDWKRVYSARSEYGLPNLSARNWLALTARAKHDSQLHHRMASHCITGSTSDRVKAPSVGELSCYIMSPSQSVFEACISQVTDEPSRGIPSMWSF